MPIDSYGYKVMSLDEIIERLTKLREEFPSTGGQPVWVANCPPMHWPVKDASVTPNGVNLFVERG